MDIGSTNINSRWRICTLASFLGLVLLVLLLKQGRDSVDLSNPRSVEVLAASSLDLFPSSTNQSSDSPSFEESREPEHEKQNGCDIFDGKWNYDPKASPLYSGAQCPFLSNQVSCQRNGRPDSLYERWSWEGNQCAIPRFNGTDMLARLRGKRVIIVGDSLNRNQWESLACLLYSSIASSDAHVEVRDGMYKVFRAKNYNCSVEFYWSPFLVRLELDRANGTSILNLDKICASAKKWKGANIMIFNTGHWWKQQRKVNTWNFVRYKQELFQNMETELAFEKAMKTWGGWIDKNVNPTETKVYFRSISPEHQGKQWCHNETQPIMDNSYRQTFPHTIREVTERTIQKTRIPVTYLNITKLSEYRRDAHPMVYTSRGGKLLTAEEKRHPEVHADCSHWCLPGLPDTWNRLLYASLVLDSTRGSSSSSHSAV
ncbi:xylan O-acetyltransferase 1-like [Rhodamnia argentea]|uniref:Xylan O-acetyltransferase 1-like n=1 Tax=Rhodamnia argentea TaxID=178133 RepID=A0ABM3GRS8_9MYRT|nr:xylan O-acetyltransferase 1-like [Rhodamnia argentea]